MDGSIYFGIKLAIFYTLLFSTSISSISSDNSEKDIFQGFFKHFDNTFELFTKHKELAEIYRHQYEDDSGILEERHVNIEEITDTFATKIRDLLLSYLDDLDKIKTKVKKSKEKHQFDPDIKPFNYLNDKQNNSARVEPRFSKDLKVNLNKSFAQVPTEIFKYDKRVLNDFTWLQSLDPVFLENFRNKPTLLWQYFSTENGASKTFPGINYDSDQVDMYDPRRRIWYNQAIMSPKDVVIAVDMSGSMTGTHLTIAKLVVSSLINTLQQDDYFNVISFNTEGVRYLIPCLRNLSEATTANKNFFKNVVDQLSHPTGEADFPQALEVAFQTLKRGALEPLMTSNCTKVIMVVSDGILYDELTEEVFAEYNGDESIVLFSFMVGFNDDPELKSVACNNGGHFYRIQTVGNVLEGVLKYQKVLSKPIGTSGANYVTFTPLYLDGSGLGMMTTISTGVFGRVSETSFSFSSSNSSETTNELIGVAGIDIVISLLEQHYPIQEMGVFGHAFVINNNGLFLMHPKFKDQSGYLTDPATVFLPEIEHTIDPDIGIELQKRMIDGETGCLQAESDWLFPKELNTRVIRLNNTYCFRPLKNTPFFAGVAIPSQNFIQSNVKPSLVSRITDNDKDFVRSGIEFLKTRDPGKTHEIANWPFCTIKNQEKMLDEPASSRYYLTSDDLHEYLTKATTNFSQTKDCDRLLNLLATSSIASNFTQRHWVDLDSVSSSKNIVDVYIISVSGLLVQWSLKPNRSRSIRRDVYEDFRLTHTASYFSKDIKHNLVFTVETIKGKPKSNPTHSSENNTSIQTITMSRSINSKNNSSLIAVIGLTMLPDQIIDYLTINFCRDCNVANPEPPSTSSSSSIAKCNFSFDCSLPDKYQCLLIDTAAYVVASNQGARHVGHFLGFINGNLLSELTDRGIFTKKIFRDAQADCPVVVTDDFPRRSPGSILHTLYSLTFYKFIFFVNRISTAIYLVVTSLMLRSEFDSCGDFVAVNAEQTVTTRNISCIKEAPIYILQNNRSTIDFAGVFRCSDHCQMYFHVKKIEGTNLLSVVSTSECTLAGAVECPLLSVSNDPVQVFEGRICDNALHYRLSRDKCYRSSAKDISCSFEYKNTEDGLFFSLILGYSCSCLSIPVVMLFLKYCKRFFY